MKKLISLVCLALTFTTSALAQYVADYDPVRNTLALPWVKIDGNYYSNVVLSVPPGEPWSLLRSGTLMNSVPADGAVYDSATSILSIPAVSVSSSTVARTQAGASLRSASVESPLLVGSVDVSLANGHWAVTRTGSSVRVTSTRDIDPIYGKIIDRFNVACKITTSGATTTEECTNNGFKAGQAFGLDTDDDGDQEQVWKVHGDSQCLTIQANNWDAIPHDADTWLGDDVAEAGTVEAEIYAHPDGLYIMRYGLNANWLSCIVIPVSGVSSVVLNNSASGGTLALSNSNLSGEVGDVLSFSITGGTPPYTVFSENTALASVAFGSVATNGAQFVTVTLNSTGQSNGDSADTQIYVFDWFQQTASIPVSITKVDSATGGGGSLSLLPGSVEEFVVGQRFQFRVLSGTPPYEVWHPYPDYIQITPVAGSSNTFQVYLAALPPGAAGLTTNSVLVTDALGNSGVLSIDFEQNAVAAGDLEVLPAQVTLFRNVQTTIGITGGVPPFNVVNPNPDWFDVWMISDRVFAIRQNSGGVSPSSSGFDQQRIPMLVLDSAGNITTLEITPDVLFGSYYQIYE
ncbi:MAG: hypothetical protein RBS05_20240 [Zoogloea oleivorans]|jgi:hypothetical protein|uniref:hypothetical protein n=1 Tax=Zoogloea oleivorans TaxID=1552750 RepID=UPI002A36E4A0|nr:hypothetical protein [Zoogloea oleivorans]MDY0038247.1 hypothetical protein [Zoogloea oleivorans]